MASTTRSNSAPRQTKTKQPYKHHARKWVTPVILVCLTAGIVVGIVLAVHYAERANNPAGADDHSFVVPVWTLSRDGSRQGIDFTSAKNSPVAVNHANIVGQARLARRSELEDAVKQNPTVKHQCTDYLWLLDGSLANVCNAKVTRLGASSANDRYGAFILISIHTKELAIEALQNTGLVPDTSRIMVLTPFQKATPLVPGDPADSGTGFPAAPAPTSP